MVKNTPILVTTVSHQALDMVAHLQQIMTIENIVTKGEIARDAMFHIFTNVFSNSFAANLFICEEGFKCRRKDGLTNGNKRQDKHLNGLWI